MYLIYLQSAVPPAICCTNLIKIKIIYAIALVHKDGTRADKKSLTINFIYTKTDLSIQRQAVHQNQPSDLVKSGLTQIYF
ncbi:MAG: hypothetical protein F6K18_09495 [Okeania sp. SIO2C2]|uniref:hypothetical protein n=1 Tax=Okeania sp. SIO2C2 TaxID=2607787 RepID=UPI0013B75006|nr:hypothetical protein [Okeania sp. SIO2C2]NEP87049.1 hypothetical protein [Okeania sp. SIO2C2]